MAKTYKQLVADVLPEIKEVFPWDLEEMLEENPDIMLVDIREGDEFDGAHIKNSIHVPRGILESACDWNYAETVPALVKARKAPVVVICRSGNRSVLAALTMQWMGYEDVYSLKSGVKGWNDSDYALFDKSGNEVDPDEADEFFNPPISPEQMSSD
jgi:rhodanese-related sulfurtransferase